MPDMVYYIRNHSILYHIGYKPNFVLKVIIKEYK